MKSFLHLKRNTFFTILFTAIICTFVLGSVNVFSVSFSKISISSTNQIPTTAESGDTINLIVHTAESLQAFTFWFAVGGETKEQEDLNITYNYNLKRFSLAYEVTPFDNGEVEFLFQGGDLNGGHSYTGETTDGSIVAVGYIPTAPTTPPTTEPSPVHSIELDTEDDTGTVGDGITSQKEDLTFSGGSTVRLLYKGQDPNRNNCAFGTIRFIVSPDSAVVGI